MEYIPQHNRPRAEHIPHIRQIYIFDVRVVDRATLYKGERPFIAHYHVRSDPCNDVCELVGTGEQEV